jgi:hypothetical protein
MPSNQPILQGKKLPTTLHAPATQTTPALWCHLAQTHPNPGQKLGTAGPIMSAAYALPSASVRKDKKIGTSKPCDRDMSTFRRRMSALPSHD